MFEFVEQLIENIKEGGEEGDEAAVLLGLLIEQERAFRPLGDDGGVRELIGPKLAARGLSTEELDHAVSLLISYIEEASEPESGAIWALNKSGDSRSVPGLVKLFGRIVDDPSQVSLAYHALQGIIINGLESRYSSMAAAVVQRAAVQGHGDVKELATDFMAQMGPPYDSD